MVKIIRKSAKEKEREVNRRNLVEIAQEIFGEDKVSYISSIHICDATRANVILVCPWFYQIDVYRADYFERAKELAQRYESKINKEFTLKLEY